MKIVYCLNNICQLGGIENITAVKANALAKIPGNEVYITVTNNERESLFPLLPEVKLINLGVDNWNPEWGTSKIRYYSYIIRKRILYKRRLKSFLKEVKPDIVISAGFMEFRFLPSLRKYIGAIISEYHFTRDWLKYCQRKDFLWRIYCFGNKWSERYVIKRYNQVVVLTREDMEKNWKGCKNVTVMPNPISFSENAQSVSSLENKKIIAAGRLVEQKNFSSLIRAFRRVVDRFPDWKLEIYGDGGEYMLLNNLIQALQLDNNVRLCGRVSNVQEKMLESSVFVLSSNYEGLPLVLLEAMSCGLPAVSYDCPCGPKDIITDGVDGFLVSKGDEQMLAEKICYLIAFPEKRAKMGAAARKKSEDYRLEKIIPRWIDLFERLIAAKRK